MKNDTQRGITLVEIIGALAISSLLLIGLTSMINASLEDSKGQQAALYQSQVVAAATKYINNSTNFINITTAGVPTAIDLNTLKTALLLPQTFPNTNVYGQTTCTIVKPRGAVAPDNQKLDALIFTADTPLSTPISEADIPAIAANAGPGNGYITGTTARGASWSLNAVQLSGFTGTLCAGVTAAPSSGHLASALFFDGPGQLSTDFLYRNRLPGAGREILNTMNTPLLLGPGAIVTDGQPCTGNGIAVSAAKVVHSCGTDNLWHPIGGRQWKDSVATYADLIATTGNLDGDVRMIRSPFYRAFAYNGAGWVPLAADQNNDFTANGISADSHINSAFNITAGQDIFANRDISVGNDLTVINNTTTKGLESEWISTEDITINSSRASGDACNIPGVNSRGQAITINPIGTFSIDCCNRWLVCAANSTFKYQNQLP